MPVLEPHQRVGDERRDEAPEAGQRDPAALGAAKRILCVLRGAQHFPRMGQEGHPLVGQPHLPPAVEERHAKLLLERADAHAYRRLGDVELGRSLGEAQVLRNAVESANLVEVHQGTL